jgi:hypothetical protein
MNGKKITVASLLLLHIPPASSTQPRCTCPPHL